MAYYGEHSDMYSNPYVMSHIAMDEAPDTALMRTEEELYLAGQYAWQFDQIESNYDLDYVTTADDEAATAAGAASKQDPILTTLHNLAGQGEWEQDVAPQRAQTAQWNTWAPTMPVVSLPPLPPNSSEDDGEEMRAVQISGMTCVPAPAIQTAPLVQQQQQQQCEESEQQRLLLQQQRQQHVLNLMKQEALYDEEEDEDEGDYMSRSGRDRFSVPINVNSFYDLTDEQLATIDFKELTRLMTEAGLTNEDILETKARRRRLKNRLSARVCSNKKREKCSELTETNRSLINRITDLEKENNRLRQENSSLKKEMSLHTCKSSSSDPSPEVTDLRTQVQQLTQMLLQAGLLSTGDAAAFAA